VLRYRMPVVASAFAALLLSYIPFSRIGSEFMPPLDEGTILYMPTTLPGIGVAKAREALQRQDSILATIPEVQSVFGKAGRASTATDPAGLDMFETTIVLKPESEWRKGMTAETITAEMDSLVRMAGFTNAWTMPIQGRIDMLATGIRTPVGIKIYGEDLHELERIGKEIERAVQTVAGTRSVFAERAVSGYYLDVEIDRQAAARYGITVEDIQQVLASAIGGMTITQTVEGRQRYAVRLRYPQELRDSPEHLASEVLIPVSQGARTQPDAVTGDMNGSTPMTGRTAQIPLGQVATIRNVSGPMVVRTEGAFPTSWVYVDVEGRDIGSYVADAKKRVDDMVSLPNGYTIQWSGKYEYMQRAKEKLLLVVPAVLLIIFLLLYLNFRSVGETVIVLLSLPFAWVGGVTIMAVLGYNWSVASAIGFIALAGVAAETGVVMLIYLDHAWDAMRLQGKRGMGDLYLAVMEGTVDRVRPKLMTVTAIIAGLLPILWASGAGASVMKRIAAPMVGGMIGAVIDELIVLPAVYSLWKEWQLRQAGSEVDRLGPQGHISYPVANRSHSSAG
jgi:copper/silver efflux system protein